MLLQLLRLAGVDIEAMIAALRAEVEAKATRAATRLKGEARRLVLLASLCVAAAVVALLGLIVSLIALYRWIDAIHGPFAALGTVGGALALLAVALVIGAIAVGQLRPSENVQRPAYQAAPPAVAPLVARTAPPRPAEDMVDPLSFLLGRYVKMPVVGLPAVDALLRHLGTSARGVTHDAVARGADLVRTGDRKTMLAVVGAAAGIGWLLVRGAGRASREDHR